MKTFCTIFSAVAYLCLSAYADMTSCAFIRRIEIGGIQEGPVSSGYYHRYTTYSSAPSGWIFLRYFCFVDHDEQRIERTGLKIDLKGKDYWLSPERQYYPFQPSKVKLPSSVRTRDDGYAVYSIFQPRAVPLPNQPYKYHYLGEVIAEAKTHRTKMEYIVSESSASSQPRPYWSPYKDGEWGFLYGSGATIGNGIRVFADYPPLKPGQDPPHYDFEKGTYQQPAAASRYEKILQQNPIPCPIETQFLNSPHIPPKIQWCRLHYKSEPNLPDSGLYSWEPVEYLIPFEEWTEPSEILQEAEILCPIFLAESAQTFSFAELLFALQPNEPNQVYPFLLEPSAAANGRTCYRPKGVLFTVADCNEPFWITEPYTGYDIYIIPTKADKIEIRYVVNAPLKLLLHYSDKWLSNYPPFDIDKDRSVKYNDLTF